MDYQTRKTDNGTEIIVQDKNAAVVVRDGEKERIFLPNSERSSDTYYVTGSESSDTYFFPGEPEQIEVFSR